MTPGRKSYQKVVKHDTLRYRRRNNIEIIFGRPKNRQRVETRIAPNARTHTFPPSLWLKLSCPGCEP